MSEELPRHLAENIRALRALRRCTQAQLAAASGVPRPTIATLESGSGNPTISVLARVARALQVTLEELIAPPRDMGRLYRVDELPRVVKRGVERRQVIPDPIPHLTLERLALPPGGRLTGIPHPPGSREYLACESGAIVLTTAASRWELYAGDVVVYRGDQSHGYANPDEGAPAVAYTLIMPG